MWQEIIPKWGPYLSKDRNNKTTRPMVILQDGTKTALGRLVMMNFLKCEKIPEVFHIHHEDENPWNNEINNLLLTSISGHAKIHNKRDTSRYGVSSAEDHSEYTKRYRIDHREEYLNQRRKEYREKLSTNPDYVLKNRKRAHDYYMANKEEINKKSREKRRMKNENSKI